MRDTAFYAFGLMLLIFATWGCGDPDAREDFRCVVEYEGPTIYCTTRQECDRASQDREAVALEPGDGAWGFSPRSQCYAAGGVATVQLECVRDSEVRRSRWFMTEALHEASEPIDPWNCPWFSMQNISGWRCDS